MAEWSIAADCKSADFMSTLVQIQPGAQKKGRAESPLFCAPSWIWIKSGRGWNIKQFMFHPILALQEIFVTEWSEVENRWTYWFPVEEVIRNRGTACRQAGSESATSVASEQCSLFIQERRDWIQTAMLGTERSGVSSEYSNPAHKKRRTPFRVFFFLFF